MADSMNCLGPVLLAAAAECGTFIPCIPEEEEAFALECLAMSPFADVPTLRDGEFSLGESSAILRYIAEKYTRETYPEVDPKRRAFIDWAMDCFTTGMYDDAVKTIYVCLGYAALPEDVTSAGMECTERLAKFAEVFLREKFVGGGCLSIADYRVAPFFFAYGHPMLKETSRVVVPDRIKQFNRDFAEACPASDLLVVRSGQGLKELMDAKHGGRAEMLMEGPVAPLGPNEMLEQGKTAGKGQVQIYGTPSSMTCVGTVMLARHAELGDLVLSSPEKEIRAPDFCGMAHFHEMPALRDGKFWMSESDAILRYLAQAYAPEFYPSDFQKRAFINWAMDRFNTGMLEDALLIIRVALGTLPWPRSSADLEDMWAAGKAASDNMTDFSKVFLKGKFVGGDELSIADFKVAPFFAAYGHPVLKERCSVDVPDRIKRFNQDFAAACDASRVLREAGGCAIKEMLDACSAEKECFQKAPLGASVPALQIPVPPVRQRLARTPTCSCLGWLA